MKANYDKPVALTCPDCGGALAASKIDGLTQFRCHIGHDYSGEAMVAAQLAELDRFIESAMRLLNERADLCRHMAQDANDLGHVGAQSIWIKAMKEAFDMTEPLEKLLVQKWIHPALGSAGKRGTVA